MMNDQKMKILKIHANDNVAVALRAIGHGEMVRVDANTKLLAHDDIAPGHKMALRDIGKGEPVLKYGFPIGRASSAITAGEWVHSHNMESGLAEMANFEYAEAGKNIPGRCDGLDLPDHFQGFVRPDGSVGVRNEIWIIPTVGCVNRTAEELARRLSAQGLPDNVEGVYAFGHPFGCSQLGGDHENTRKILAGLARHPNAAGCLVLGLGCENNQIEAFRKLIFSADDSADWMAQKCRFMVAQDVADEIESGMEMLEELAAQAADFHREPVPISKLKIGLKCGGSDAFSGITANPVVGAAADMLVDAGAACVLTEVPEMFGAEQILLERCASRKVFDAAVSMIQEFKNYYIRHNEPVYENPSPGNREGGITTLEEKSIGCVQKGGSGMVTGVLGYGNSGLRPGLNLLNGPGNDIVSTTNMATAGAHIVLFTTGRGTPLGCPVPTIKIASNSRLAQGKPGWIDFDAGRLLSGEGMNQLAKELVRIVIDVSSGTCKTQNEKRNYRDIAIWKTGVTL
ncbi:MAG: UxaA family hydrolase [Candidatus Sumerlaeia bacterium]